MSSEQSAPAQPETKTTSREALLRRLEQEDMIPLVRAVLIVWLVSGVLALAVAGVWVLYQIRAVFPPLVLALALIFILNPIVSRLERRGVRRGAGTALIYLLFLILVFLVGLGLAPPLRRQLSELVDQLPDLAERSTALAERIAARFRINLEEQNVSDLLNRLQGQIFSGIDQITRFAGGAAHLVLVFILAPIIALYLLIDLPRIQRSFVESLPPRYRDEWLGLLRRCGNAVGGFFRGQLLVAAIVGAMSSVALLLAGIPFWLPIGLLAGFFNIIPFIGPWIGAFVAVIVGGATGGWSLALRAGIAMLIVQQVDNHFISPKVMGRALSLHPVTIILALLAGGAVAGLWGMLLAVPGTGVAKILIMHYYTAHILGRREGLQEEGSRLGGGIEESAGAERKPEGNADAADAGDAAQPEQSEAAVIVAGTPPRERAGVAKIRSRAPGLSTGKRGRPPAPRKPPRKRV